MTPDPAKCRMEVPMKTEFPRWRQCKKAAVLDGWCAVHHPNAVKARREKTKARFEARIAQLHREIDAGR